MRSLGLLAPLIVLAACQSGATSAPGTSPDGFTGIAADEEISFTGTEPFWGGTVQGETLVFSTPDDIEGTTITVRRFTGQGGLGFSGMYREQTFDMAVTPGECSDGMSDRSYPYTVTLRLGDSTLLGCAYTEREPFDGPENP